MGNGSLFVAVATGVVSGVYIFLPMLKDGAALPSVAPTPSDGNKSSTDTVTNRTVSANTSDDKKDPTRNA